MIGSKVFKFIAFSFMIGLLFTFITLGVLLLFFNDFILKNIDDANIFVDTKINEIDSIVKNIIKDSKPGNPLNKDTLIEDLNNLLIKIREIQINSPNLDFSEEIKSINNLKGTINDLNIESFATELNKILDGTQQFKLDYINPAVLWIQMNSRNIGICLVTIPSAYLMTWGVFEFFNIRKIKEDKKMDANKIDKK